MTNKKDKILKDFNYFINTEKDYFDSSYKYIDFFCLEYCSFVTYLFIPCINGEISGHSIVFDYDVFHGFPYIHELGEGVLYAINYLDNIVLEVVNY